MMTFEITLEEYNSGRLLLDNTVEITSQRFFDQPSKGISKDLFKKKIIGMTSEELWNAIRQNSRVKNESSSIFYLQSLLMTSELHVYEREVCKY